MGHNYFLITTFWALFIRHCTRRRRDIVHDIAERQPDPDCFIGSGILRQDITPIIKRVTLYDYDAICASQARDL